MANIVLAGPGYTTYQAKIIKPDGYPLEANNVNFRFTILNPLGTCILYSENYAAVNMTGTGGVISFALGSGVKVFPASATTFAEVFSNITPALACDVGGPGIYNPGSSDVRKIVMQFHDNSGWQTLPAMNINAVPYAMYANDAQNLGGVSATSFVQRTEIPSCSGGEAMFYNGTNFSCVTLGGGGAVSAAAITAALGYTPANGASITAVSSDVSSLASYAANVSSTVFSVSSTVTSLENSFSSFQATTAASFAAIAGVGISTFNGSTSATQSLGNSLSGTTPAFVTANGVHTLNIPYASEGTTTAGLISNSEYSLFSTVINKITSSAASIAQVLGYTPADQATVTTLSLTVGAVSTTANSALALANAVSSSVNSLGSNKITSSAASVAEVLGFNPADQATVNAVSTTANTALTTANSKITSSAAAVEQVLGYVPADSVALSSFQSTTTASFAAIAGVGISSLNGATSATQAFANGVAGTAPAFNTANGVHTLNIPFASAGATTAGVISNTDYSLFSTVINKITSSAASIAQVLGYTPADQATVTTLSSTVDAVSTTANSALALANAVSSSVNSLGSNKITSSAASVAEVLGYTAADQVTVAAVSTTANTALTTANSKITSSAAAVEQVLGYVPADSAELSSFQSTTVASLTALAGAGISSFNGSSSATQSLGNSLAGTTPAFVTANGVHTLNIPFASAGATTAGLISNTDYSLFSTVINKITSSAASITQVLGYTPADQVTVGAVSTTANAALTTANSKITSSAAAIAQVLGYVPGPATGSTQWTTSGTAITYNSGNVGIGIANPRSKLNVVGSLGLMIGDWGGGTGMNQHQSIAQAPSSFTDSLAEKPFTLIGGNSFLDRSEVLIGGSTNMSSEAAAQNIIFYTHPTKDTAMGIERMRVASNGRVGIATNNPGYALEVSGTIASTNGGYRFPDNTTQTTAFVSGASGIAQQLGYVPASSATLSSFQAATVASLTALSGSGISAFNGSTSATQSLANGTAGNSPAFVSANGVHTLNIPFASAGATTAGLISNSDYSLFSTVINKITSSAASIAQVLGYTPADQAAVTTLSSTVDAVSTTANAALTAANTKITSSAASIAQVLGYTPAASGGVSSQWTTSGTTINYVAGNVGIGTTSPMHPLHVHKSAGGDPNILLTDGDQVHPFSAYYSLIPANTVGYMANNHATGGGLALYGLTSNASTYGLSLNSYLGSASPTVAAFNIVGQKLNGGGATLLASDETLMIVRNLNNPVFTLKGSGNLGIGTTNPVTKLEVSGGVRISMESAACAVSYAGTLRYNAGNVEYCNGTTWTAFGAAGSGVGTFNGSTSSTQTLAAGTTGTAPSFSTVNGVHTLNIPYASAGTTTAGLISNTDYVNFSNKITSSAASIAQVLGYMPAASGTSLTNFTESVNTAAPNATVPVVRLLANNAAANVDVALSPKGTGALTAHSADNTAAGGNKRGTNAVDWQTNRGVAGAVAGAADSVIGGGVGNTIGAGSTGSVIAGGGYNSANGSNNAAIGGGSSNSANGQLSTVPGGYGNSAAAYGSTAMGYSTTANGQNSLTANYFTTSAAFAQAVFGAYNLPKGGETSNSWVTTDPLFTIGNGTGATSRSTAVMVLKNGNVGFGTNSPSAVLHLTSGTTTVAPLKLTSGSLLTTPASGSIEYDGFNFYATNGAGTRSSLTGMVSSQWTTSGTAIGYLGGSVGVGTASPRTAFDVAPATGQSIIRATSTNSTSALQLYRNTAGAYAGPVLWSNGTSLNFGYDTTENSGPTLMTLDTNGNLGVGISGSGAALEVYRNNGSDAAIALTNASPGNGSYITSIANSNFSGYTSTGVSQTWFTGQYGSRNYVIGDLTNGKVPFTITSNAPANSFVLLSSGTTGIGVAVPTAKLHIASGSTTVAPFKITSGALTTVAQAGSIEYDGFNFYTTNGAGTRTSLGGSGITSSAAAIAQVLGYTPAASGSGTTSKWTASGTTIYYNTGNVGVGTTNPINNFHLHQPTGGNSSLFKFTTADSGATNSDGTTFGVLAGGVDVQLWNYENGYFRIGTAGAERMRITSTGSVGIGTASPVGTLSIENATVPSIQMKKTGAGAVDTFNMINDMDATGFFWFAKGASATTAPTTANRLVAMTNAGNMEIYGQETNGSNDNSGVLALKTQKSTDGGTRNEVSMEFYADGTNIDTPSGYLGYESNTVYDLALHNVKAGSLLFGTNNITRMSINSAGNVAVGLASATAKFHLAAGTTSLAPMKLTSGPLLTTPASGSIEYDGFNFYTTNGAGTRTAIGSGGGSVTSATIATALGYSPVSSAAVAWTVSGTTLEYSGKVAIGSTIDPTTPLQVYGNANATPSVASSIFSTRSSFGTGIFMGSYNAMPFASWIQAADHTGFFPYSLVLSPQGGNVSIGNNNNPGSRLVVKGLGTTSATSALNVTDSANSSKLYVGNDGNVGVGTITPSAKMDILGDLNVGVQSSPVSTTIKMGGPWTGYGLRTWRLATEDGRFSIKHDLEAFQVEQVPLTILQNNNVGIGTASPSFTLDVQTQNAITARYMHSGNNANDGAAIMMTRTRGTLGVNFGAQAGDTIGGLYFRAHNGVDANVTNAAIEVEAYGTQSASNRANYMIFETTASGATTRAERMRISESGYVGIGTTNPYALLSIGPNSSGATPNLAYVGSYTTGQGSAQWAGNWAGSGYWGMGPATAAGDNTIRIGNMAATGLWSSTQNLNLTLGGGLGIGVTVPAKALHVSAPATSMASGLSNMILEDNSAMAINQGPGMSFKATYNTSAATAVIGGLWAVKENATNNDYAGSILIGGRVNGGNINTPVTIRSTGAVGIGSAPTAGFMLDVAGNVRATGSIASWSDIRVKKNIEVIPDSLNKILSLRGVTFDWRNEEFPDKKFKTTRDIGVIAQEVEKVFPEAVTTSADSYKSVQYPSLVAPLIEAVKELYVKVTKLFEQTEKNTRAIASLEEKDSAKDKQIEALKLENERKDKELREMKERLDRIEKALQKK